MERLALAVFDIKPLQFSQEKKGRPGVGGDGLDCKESCMPLCGDAQEWAKYLPFFSQAISGFGKK